MDITPEARQRLTALMDARRLDLGLTWRELAVRAGVSYESLRTLRSGPGGMRPLMMRKLDAGLQWAPGSLERVAGGGDPDPLGITHAGHPDGGGSPQTAGDDNQAFLDAITPEERRTVRDFIETLRRSRAAQDERHAGNGA